MGRPWVGRAPLSREEIQRVGPQARKWAAEQILNVWRREKDKSKFERFWGDELEYVMVDLDLSESRATALLCQDSVLQRWNEQIANRKLRDNLKDEDFDLQTEWASFSIESTPSKPYTEGIGDLLNVEKSMKQRRTLIKSLLGPSQYPLTITSFPRLGVKGRYTTPDYGPSQSDIHYRMLPPEVMSPSLRYTYVAQQILGRRKRPAGVHIQLFQDKNMPRQFLDDPLSLEYGTTDNASVQPEKDYIYLEGQAFGAGCCALQATFQTASEHDARWLHDQLVVLGPIMLALTAATPMFGGYLVNTDSRWNCLVASSDDRTLEETTSFIESPHTCCSVPLTRWSSNRVYLSHERPSDIVNACGQVRVDEMTRRQLLDGGMDESLASYFSHLLWHDPLCLNQDDVDDVNPEATHIFQKFQSGVWNHVHLKMPDSESGAGWRVEFRPMEVQLKDSENAAFAVFMFLLSQAIVTYRLNFYVPIELVTDSMQRAQKLDAVTEERVWFRRRDWAPNELNSIQCIPEDGYPRQRSTDNTYGLMTIDEIVNGENSTSPSRFPGLVAIARSYLLERELLPNEEVKLMQYLNLLSCRASGSLPTPARWMRDFVDKHEDYQHDSIVGERVCYDLLREVVKMNEAD